MERRDSNPSNSLLTSFRGLDEEFLTSENFIAFVNDVNNGGEISENRRG